MIYKTKIHYNEFNTFFLIRKSNFTFSEFHIKKNMTIDFSSKFLKINVIYKIP